MDKLTPNAEKLVKCLKYFASQGYTNVDKQKLKREPYCFNDSSVNELSQKRIITENEDKICLIN
jgi:hypothetical protein